MNDYYRAPNIDSVRTKAADISGLLAPSPRMALRPHADYGDEDPESSRQADWDVLEREQGAEEAMQVEEDRRRMKRMREAVW